MQKLKYGANTTESSLHTCLNLTYKNGEGTHAGESNKRVKDSTNQNTQQT